MKAILLFTAIAFCFSVQDASLKPFHFLAGTWKTEGKQSFETWQLNKSGEMKGNDYKLKGGQKEIGEELMIHIVAGKVIYTARVLNQNEGKPVDFVLNTSVKDKFSFENPTHDFPKKIQYTKLNDTAVFISVLGANDKGFSYKMFRQNDKPVIEQIKNLSTSPCNQLPD